MAASPPPRRVLVLAPVFDDWGAARLLLERLDVELERAGLGAQVLFVDDGSPSRCPDEWRELAPRVLARIDVLELRRNVGHQRAIALGLAWVQANVPCDVVVVMDADGEDDPSDVAALVEAVGRAPPRRIAFAGRKKRSESLAFRAFYLLYQLAFRLLTGRAIRVGNFSAVPRELLATVATLSEIGVHYAAGVQRSRVPCVVVPTVRARRLAGASRMNFVGLVTHGLSAIAVQADTVATRLLIATAVLAGAIALPLAAFVALRLATGEPLPPRWAAAVAAVSFLLVQALVTSLLLALTVLNGRTTYAFVPLRDHAAFVAGVRGVCERRGAGVAGGELERRTAATS
jgi:hypothetical protein